MPFPRFWDEALELEEISKDRRLQLDIFLDHRDPGCKFRGTVRPGVVRGGRGTCGERGSAGINTRRGRGGCSTTGHGNLDNLRFSGVCGARGGGRGGRAGISNRGALGGHGKGSVSVLRIAGGPSDDGNFEGRIVEKTDQTG